MFLVDKPRHSNADLILALLKTRPMRLKEIAYELSIDVRVVSTALARLHREGCILTPERTYSFVKGRPGRKSAIKRPILSVPMESWEADIDESW